MSDTLITILYLTVSFVYIFSFFHVWKSDKSRESKWAWTIALFLTSFLGAGIYWLVYLITDRTRQTVSFSDTERSTGREFISYNEESSTKIIISKPYSAISGSGTQCIYNPFKEEKMSLVNGEIESDPFYFFEQSTKRAGYPGCFKSRYTLLEEFKAYDVKDNMMNIHNDQFMEAAKGFYSLYYRKSKDGQCFFTLQDVDEKACEAILRQYISDLIGVGYGF